MSACLCHFWIHIYKKNTTQPIFWWGKVFYPKREKCRVVQKKSPLWHLNTSSCQAPPGFCEAFYFSEEAYFFGRNYGLSIIKCRWLSCWWNLHAVGRMLRFVLNNLFWKRILSTCFREREITIWKKKHTRSSLLTIPKEPASAFKRK